MCLEYHILLVGSNNSGGAVPGADHGGGRRENILSVKSCSQQYE